MTKLFKDAVELNATGNLVELDADYNLHGVKKMYHTDQCYTFEFLNKIKPRIFPVIS